MVYLFSLVSSFFAGHLQIFFYVGLFSFVYFICRWFQYGRNRKVLILYIILNTLYVMLTAVQWAPTLQFIFLSARGVDTFDFNNPGWFIPWQHLVQFIAPDFFGNPTTLNYWSVWNYGELVGYVGIIPLILALLAMFYRRDKKTLFFGTFFFLAIIFSFPTFFAKIPYILEVPFLSTSQPTRLLFVVDFTLAVLAALGFDYLLKTKKKIAVIYPLTFVAVIILILWIFTPKEHFQVIRSNLLLPTVILISASVLFILLTISAKYKRIVWIIYALIIMITLFDLLRFGWKFTPFTPKSYLFPSTKTISFLQNNLGDFRIMSTDSRVLPPNFSTMYRLKSVDGYDPLYLLRYGELIAASERRRADITPPFGFNRIITPQNYDSKIIDLMGVKYVLSLTGLSSKKLNKVFQEGETRIYENLNVVPRVFFASKLMPAKDKEEAIGKMFDDLFAPNDMAVVEGLDEDFLNMETITVGKSKIIHYSENKVVIETENSGIGFLILTDTFYPTWRVKIDEVKEKIYKTDYNFRGVVVPAGRHKIEFYNSLI
ncbi:MAG: YfhO family protein [Candidatus Levybacteria bacterium]|nr:YfhO family protein [Candidatus Levybacteria bacterium]